jgi:Niemann-Pick C1 protein
VKCVDLTLTVLYIILICVLLGWGLYHRKRERKPAYRTKSVSNVVSGGVLYSRNQEKDENLPMHQVHNWMLFLHYEHTFESYLPFFLNVFCFLSFLMHACLSNPDFVLIGGFDSKIIEDVSQNRNEVRLSAVQGYMSNFYRSLPMISTFISTHIEQYLWLHIYKHDQEVWIICS